jgi:hypothetical protein
MTVVSWVGLRHYGRYYRATSIALLASIDALLGRLEEKCNMVHLFADVTENGTIRDASAQELTGNRTHPTLL